MGGRVKKPKSVMKITFNTNLGAFSKTHLLGVQFAKETPSKMHKKGVKEMAYKKAIKAPTNMT